MSIFSSIDAQEQWLDGAGGVRIFVRHWRPQGGTRAALVICHGVNSHGGQYLRAAEAFTKEGFAVTALDLRGRGRSEGERFYTHGIDEYVSDLSQTIELARARDPEASLFLLGHSAGGVVSVSYALDHQDRIDGLICESFAFRVFAPDIALSVLKGASHVAPHLHVLKLKMEDFSRDPEWVAQLLADPLTKNEVQPVQTVAALTRAGERFEREFGRITLPVLILHGTADKATRPDGSQEFFDKAGSADKQLILYDGYYHDLLNDVGRERVMGDIVGWIEARLTPQLSADQATPQVQAKSPLARAAVTIIASPAGAQSTEGSIAVSQIITADGTTIFYKDWGPGDAQPIVFHHGWPLSADDWDNQMMFFLQEGYRVIAHDRRGHGRSSQTDTGNDMDTYAADVIELAAALDLRDAIHVGHSTGGGEVAHYVARAEPGRVARAALIGAVPPVMVKSDANPGGLPLEVFDGLRASLLANRAQFYRDLPEGPFYGFNREGAEPIAGVVDNWWRQGMMGGAKAHYDCIAAFSETDFTEDLKAIDVPTLVMHGTDDQIVPYDDSAPLSVALLRNGTLKSYEGLPHGMCTTHADIINADLLAFIREEAPVERRAGAILA